jgi:flavin reductase (DIM6/NTAB) family NADH-FMN oxidoreductase RutF
MPVDAKSFKDALSRFPSGVTVVTVEDADEVLGITVSAFLSVSLDPPLVLVSIDRRARSHDVFARAERFAVSVLGVGQEAVSNFYAGYKQPGQTVDLVRPDGAVPVVPEAVVWLQCALHAAVPAGDHTLYIGRVDGVTVREGEPLLYFRGRYRTFAE